MTDPRGIDFTFPGTGDGPIRAMMPTPELRERLKPFVFLDDVVVTEHSEPWGFPYHPHSGVATFTFLQVGDLDHEDTDGHGGSVPAGSVQWMATGGGVWHREYYEPVAGRVSALQLWVVLPPGMEDGDVGYQTATSAELPVVSGTRVLAGSFEGAESPIRTPYPFNYFDVDLGPGESWRFTPPEDHDVAWMYNHAGDVSIAGNGHSGQTLIVFDGAAGDIVVSAGPEGAKFVLGSAAQTPWPIVASRGSMHTNRESLERGMQRIQDLGRGLQATGRR